MRTWDDTRPVGFWVLIREGGGFCRQQGWCHQPNMPLPNQTATGAPGMRSCSRLITGLHLPQPTFIYLTSEQKWLKVMCRGSSRLWKHHSYFHSTVFLKDVNEQMKDKSTLSRSSGCVQHAAPALPNPPKYHLATIFVFCFGDSDAIVIAVTAYTLKKTAHITHSAKKKT